MGGSFKNKQGKILEPLIEKPEKIRNSIGSIIRSGVP